jgi:hypothetical protein
VQTATQQDKQNCFKVVEHFVEHGKRLEAPNTSCWLHVEHEDADSMAGYVAAKLDDVVVMQTTPLQPRGEEITEIVRPFYPCGI